ncbi:ATP-dependent zinc protease family protein [Modicisalibacter radicis]|uniref:ATP-dependent zinc protease family protein n=1 Tax=Halomonas sp. EAR18 TaxID=2518972 RepID=UPI00109C18D3|nr:ATP-dependent zinc protease [Halomonas sp. EAR18]
MPNRLTRLAVLAGLVAIGGCALQPPPQDNRFAPLLTHSQFDSRLNALERSIEARCDTQRLERNERTLHLESLTSGVHGIAGQLRNLQEEVQGLQRESQVEVPDCPTNVDDSLDNKEVLGRNEWVGLPGVGTYLKARLDTGANTGSISAREITEFERDGEDWVRFKLALDDDAVAVEAARDRWIEAEVVRRVRIIQASGEESRPVISLMMSLGPIKQHVEFTLNDRTHLSYPVLLGRRFMMDIAVIDVAQSYLHPRPEFPGGEPAAQAGADEMPDGGEDEEVEEDE